ncbi:restriction endonuclease subunit S [Streptococcus suis]|uniref:restriction endonuclease subunit S n=1 Tax=Streptococcus suis TaxID=1307 RepID=UPI000C179F24|nr:restriction endonuclease subunit S [Streptococcus suis]
MGSDPTPPAKRRRRHKKALSPRLAKLDKEFEEAGGEWREYHLVELFGKSTRGKRLKSSDRVCGTLPFVTAGEENTGISAYIGNDVEIFRANSITIDMFGSAKFRGYDFGADDHVAVVHTNHLPKAVCQFITVAIHKSSYSGKFSYSRNFYAKDADELVISLPTINNNLAFSYMENYIKTLEAERIETLEAERIETLEAYLTVTGLKEYHLTKNDEKILDTFTKLTDTESRVEYLGILSLSPVSMRELFPSIHQGRRLKKDDQIRGDLPFVMAGTTNTGIVGKIGNDVRKFPKQSITIDIFGNTFYRGYEFGAGDDTGVFWNTENTQPKSLLFLKTIIEKQLLGKYDFGHKLRASQTYDMEFQIPTQNNQPDYTFMSDFIKVIEKLVIKDLVEWTDKKIQATKEVVAQH